MGYFLFFFSLPEVSVTLLLLNDLYILLAAQSNHSYLTSLPILPAKFPQFIIWFLCTLHYKCPLQSFFLDQFLTYQPLSEFFSCHSPSFCTNVFLRRIIVKLALPLSLSFSVRCCCNRFLSSLFYSS